MGPKVEPKLENPAVPAWGTLNLDTQASQMRRSQPYSQPQRSQPFPSLPKPEQKAKAEDAQDGAPLVDSSAQARIQAAAEAEPPKQRVQHPTGTWLPRLEKSNGTAAKEELTTVVDGVEITRAAWYPGHAEVFIAAPH